MAINNAQFDPSEQTVSIDLRTATVATGISQILWNAPFPCVIKQLEVAFYGISGAPQWSFYVSNNLSTGVTGILIGISNLLPQHIGTSGPISFSGLAAVGSTLLNLDAGDSFCFSSSVANAAISSSSLNLIVKKTQDYVTYFGN